ncbi:DUF2911 domain-containing protein [Flavisolibacter sp. BT320]|nr:DUF2911 domain-containing protein [Flavisolibacter longurius]
MKYTLITLLLVTLLGFSAQAQKEEVCYNPNLVKDTTKKSIKSMAVGTVGSDTIAITYHSPGVRKRIIWGGLVPFDEVWVTGAHDATTVTFVKPVVIDGKTVPAGKYAFFTIPGNEEWTLILNKHWKQHLASEYDEKDDVVRVKVKPTKVPHTERLQYFIEEAKDNSARLVMAWERVKVTLPFTVQQ